MADSGVPFRVDAASVPLVENLNDIPVGDGFTVEVLMTVDDGDDPTAMTFVGKTDPDESDIALTTFIKTVTQTDGDSGVILPTDDPKVWRAQFQFTRQEAVRISNQGNYVYSVTATIDRDDTDIRRMVQRGDMTVTLFAIENENSLADGVFYADGSLVASGFDN